MLEQLGLFTKKYLFSSLLIIAGIILVIVAVTPNEAVDRTQSGYFLFGAFSVLVAGVVSLLYAMELISKIVHLAIMSVLMIGCVVLTVFSINSLNDTIAKQEAQKVYVDEVKQSLEDIRTIQLAYKKVYGHYASDFKELKRFLLEDEVYNTVPVILHESGKIPDRQPKGWELDSLGYDPIEDEALIKDGIDENEAMILGWYRVDTNWVPVMQDLFFSIEAKKNDEFRKFTFDPEKLSVIRNTDDGKEHYFDLKTKVLEEDSVSMTNAFLVTDTYAFNPFKEEGQRRDTLKLGSLDLSDESTNGSWEQ